MNSKKYLIDNKKLMEQWNYEKNIDINPFELTLGSNKKAWWKCEKNHIWQASINNRSKGKNCPYCANHKLLTGYNDLATLYPDIAKEWHPTENGNVFPSNVKSGSNEKYWWLCPVCKEKYQASPNKRIYGGTGCPYCSHNKIRKKDSLGEKYPEIASEWNYEKNIGTPFDYATQSNKKVWWICKKCNQEYASIISNRVRLKSGCPVCTNLKIVRGINDLQTLNPILALEWDYDKNKKEPYEFGIGAIEKVWWKCEFGHEWMASIVQRNNKKTECPVCLKFTKTSLKEQIIYYYIKKYFPDAVNSYKNEFLNDKEIDIYIPSINVGIEYDGCFWHKDVEKDIQKDNLCNKNRIKLIRVRESRCLPIIRKDPTIKMDNESNEALEKAIIEIFKILKVKKVNIDIKKDYLEIKESFHKYAIKNSLANKYPDIAKEWHPTKNGNLTPKNIPATRSLEKYFWKCQKDNYVWQASLDRRIAGTGCPVCNGKVVLNGYNDLTTLYPDIAKEWHPTKNGNLKPNQFSKGSHKKIIWICPIGHEYIAHISDRVRGTKCPYCANKKVLEGFNDFATIMPELLKDWDYENNIKAPTTITIKSGYKANWKCHKCGKKWSAYVYSRTEGAGCPYCRKKLNKNKVVIKTQ